MNFEYNNFSRFSMRIKFSKFWKIVISKTLRDREEIFVRQTDIFWAL
jgi:hypothetical protein